MGMGKTYSRLSNGEINQRYGVGHVEKIPLRYVDPDVPLTTEQHSAMCNYATFRGNKPNGYGLQVCSSLTTFFALYARLGALRALTSIYSLHVHLASFFFHIR